jgi:hypothetical protein
MSPLQKNIPGAETFRRSPHMFNSTIQTQVILRKAYFLRRGSWLRAESWTPRPWIQNSGPYYWDAHQRTYVQNFSSLGALPAEK